MGCSRHATNFVGLAWRLKLPAICAARAGLPVWHVFLGHTTIYWPQSIDVVPDDTKPVGVCHQQLMMLTCTAFSANVDVMLGLFCY